MAIIMISAIFQPITSGRKSSSPSLDLNPLETSHSLKYEVLRANVTSVTQSLTCPSPARQIVPEAHPPLKDIPMPKMIPPIRLPIQKPGCTATSQDLKSVHLRIVNPITLMMTASTTALVASASPVMKGSLNALTKQKRERCITIPISSPKSRKPPVTE